MADEVRIRHPEYVNKQFIWRSVRDAIDGTSSVKRAHEVYLPMPTGMSIESTAPSITTRTFGISEDDNLDYSPQNLPWYHPNPAYMAYLQRARFPEIASYAIRGLVGVATKESPTVDLSSSIDYLEERATLSGLSLVELYSEMIYEVICTGRVAIVLNIDIETNLPYLTTYTAESIINWSGHINESGKYVLDLFVLEERNTVLEEDGFEHKTVVRNIVFRKDDDGVTVTIYEDNEIISESTPSLQGKALDEIPVFIVGPTVASGACPGAVPILGIVEISYSIYRKDADLSNGEFLTCNPTLYMTGVQPDMRRDPTNTTGALTPAPDGRADKVLIGSNVILKISNPSATIGYTQTDTGGLGHVQARIQALFTEASEYGASMIGPTKKGVESKEALGMKRADTGATLVDIVKSVSKGINLALDFCDSWRSGASIDDISENEFAAVTDFAELGLSAREIHALVTTWMARGISHETLLYNMKEAGYLEDGRTVEEEINTIELETPLLPNDGKQEGEYGSI